MISIKNLPKAEVLQALFNHSKQQGMGFLHGDGVHQMTLEQAEHEVANTPLKYWDYLKGRVMKIDLSGDEFNPAMYDRDNSQGAAERAIANIR